MKMTSRQALVKTGPWQDSLVYNDTRNGAFCSQIYESESDSNRTFGNVRPAKIQISLRIRAVWSESSLGAFWIAMDAKLLHADNENSDQTEWMRRLIWVIVGRTCQKVRFPILRVIYWELTDDITDQELSFLLGTPRHILNKILMYFENQYLPCRFANHDEILVIWFLWTLRIIKVKFQVP